MSRQNSDEEKQIVENPNASGDESSEIEILVQPAENPVNPGISTNEQEGNLASVRLMSLHLNSPSPSAMSPGSTGSTAGTDKTPTLSNVSISPEGPSGASTSGDSKDTDSTGRTPLDENQMVEAILERVPKAPASEVVDQGLLPPGNSGGSKSESISSGSSQVHEPQLQPHLGSAEVVSKAEARDVATGGDKKPKSELNPEDVAQLPPATSKGPHLHAGSTPPLIPSRKQFLGPDDSNSSISQSQRSLDTDNSKADVSNLSVSLQDRKKQLKQRKPSKPQDTKSSVSSGEFYRYSSPEPDPKTVPGTSYLVRADTLDDAETPDLDSQLVHLETPERGANVLFPPDEALIVIPPDRSRRALSLPVEQGDKAPITSDQRRAKSEASDDSMSLRRGSSTDVSLSLSSDRDPSLPPLDEKTPTEKEHQAVAEDSDSTKSKMSVSESPIIQLQPPVMPVSLAPGGIGPHGLSDPNIENEGGEIEHLEQDVEDEGGEMEQEGEGGEIELLEQDVEEGEENDPDEESESERSEVLVNGASRSATTSVSSSIAGGMVSAYQGWMGGGTVASNQPGTSDDNPETRPVEPLPLVPSGKDSSTNTSSLSDPSFSDKSSSDPNILRGTVSTQLSSGQQGQEDPGHFDPQTSVQHSKASTSGKQSVGIKMEGSFGTVKKSDTKQPHFSGTVPRTGKEKKVDPSRTSKRKRTVKKSPTATSEQESSQSVSPEEGMAAKKYRSEFLRPVVGRPVTRSHSTGSVRSEDIHKRTFQEWRKAAQEETLKKESKEESSTDEDSDEDKDPNA